MRITPPYRFRFWGIAYVFHYIIKNSKKQLFFKKRKIRRKKGEQSSKVLPNRGRVMQKKRDRKEQNLPTR